MTSSPGAIPPTTGQPRLSVVIPTFQRRALVLGALASLEAQQLDAPWEVVVVVDGSTDGTAAALRARRTILDLHVVEQPNRGLSHARNAGAAAARGELVLFLDDDMVAAPGLLAEHDRAHRSGADVVMGVIPMHPDVPDTAVTRATAVHVDALHARVAGAGPLPPVAWNELVGGQMSVRRALLDEVGGFDPSVFGVEDWELGHRLARNGAAMVCNPTAVSFQRYSVSARQLVSKNRRHGTAEVQAARKHPELARALLVEAWERQGAAGRAVRLVALLLPWLVGPVVHPLSAATSVLDRLRLRGLARRTLSLATTVAYWHGAADAGLRPAELDRIAARQERAEPHPPDRG